MDAVGQRGGEGAHGVVHRRRIDALGILEKRTLRHEWRRWALPSLLR